MISKVEKGIEEEGGKQENRNSSLALIIRETLLTTLRALKCGE